MFFVVGIQNELNRNPISHYIKKWWIEKKKRKKKVRNFGLTPRLNNKICFSFWKKFYATDKNHINFVCLFVWCDLCVFHNSLVWLSVNEQKLSVCGHRSFIGFQIPKITKKKQVAFEICCCCLNLNSKKNFKSLNNLLIDDRFFWSKFDLFNQIVYRFVCFFR